jgi:hypothetical protein
MAGSSGGNKTNLTRCLNVTMGKHFGLDKTTRNFYSYNSREKAMNTSNRIQIVTNRSPNNSNKNYLMKNQST